MKRTHVAALLVLPLVVAACGAGQRRATTSTTSTTSRVAECTLSPTQRRDVARAKREIARMHRLETPLKTWHEHGPWPLELAVNRFLLDVGPLPADVKGLLMDKGKSAVGLCGDCFNAIEAEEPAVQTRFGGSAC